jgi:DNA processing protein
MMDCMDIKTEKIFYNAVAIALGGDPSLVRKIRKRSGPLFSSWEIIYEKVEELRENNESVGATPIISVDPEDAWSVVKSLGIDLVLFDDPQYPTLLRQIHNPPLGLYIRGKFPMAEYSFTVVGTRRATADGKLSAKRFGRELASAGFTIVSGLALGVDAAAHEGCLEAGGGAIAVLAGGLNEIYPATNEWLGKKILENGGAIISEYPPGSPPYGPRFLERNRIVSGLSVGSLIIEAPERSGSLATANFALQQNRDVFVIPGPITHPNFFGSHALIRQGAELVTKPDDILEAYSLMKEKLNVVERRAANDEEKLILAALKSIRGAAEVDKIIEMTKLEPRIANQTLSMLVLKNIITETESGYIIE